MTATTDAVLGLGSNVGERRVALAAAIEALSAYPDITIIAASPLYESAPWGMTDQQDFLNAAVRIATALAPADLLAAILAIEVSLGRVRRKKWGPRVIDIDILVYGEERIDVPGLTIPHPHLTERIFALAPLVDVMPEAVIADKPARQWLAQLQRKGLKKIAEPEWAEPEAQL
ncbi:MAG TPA: 2-amino-4-hydroxy-6-hydroxymethyldihydropteridine diphosphokinase [Afifellaceae bacterium]|nr:2-amino-4-hydroxy-6-hydroxymethyldihydropteridine diphosphokinase [Afifellaceae bacterium]